MLELPMASAGASQPSEWDVRRRGQTWEHSGSRGSWQSKPHSRYWSARTACRRCQAEILGEAQGIVHKAVAEMGRFERLRRDESWVRRGYVEEIYVPVRSGGAHAEPRVIADPFYRLGSPVPSARATVVRD